MRKIGEVYRLELGGDPEFFFTNKSNAIGAHNLLPEKGVGSIYRDGFGGEINPAPNTCREIFLTYIKELLTKLKEKMETFEKDTGKKLNVTTKATIEVSQDALDSSPEDVRQFGCDPSNDAYNGSKGAVVIDASKHLQRYCGGHIHLGGNSYVNYLHDHAVEITKTLDMVVGNTCVMLDNNHAAKERRKFYGKAGEFRTPKHGLEYRVLSSFWLKHPTYVSFVYGLARASVYLYMIGLLDKDIIRVDEDKIIEAINNNDYCLAVENASLVLPVISNMFRQVKDMSSPLNKQTYKVVLGFLIDQEFVLKDHGNMFKNWEETQISSAPLSTKKKRNKALQVYEREIQNKKSVIHKFL